MRGNTRLFGVITVSKQAVAVSSTSSTITTLICSSHQSARQTMNRGPDSRRCCSRLQDALPGCGDVVKIHQDAAGVVITCSQACLKTAGGRWRVRHIETLLQLLGHSCPLSIDTVDTAFLPTD